jgi:rRNA maturation protein Nop10
MTRGRLNAAKWLIMAAILFVAVAPLRAQPILQARSTPPTDHAGLQLLIDRCGACHGLTLKDRCLTGDCATGRVHAVIPRPWDLVVRWMRAMGCTMTDAEQASITGYLMTHYAAHYPVRWEAMGSVTGGWNVVALAPFQGRLFAGIEGNGSIVRLTDGQGWAPVLTTPNYTIYGLVPFHDQLYAATNDPAAEIWSSGDGEHWVLRSRLAGEKGIISLGLFQGKLYAGTARAAIYQSPDGINWSPAGRLLPDAGPAYSNWVRFLVPFDGALYAGIEHGGVYRSDDGAGWRPDWPADAQPGVRGAALFRGVLYVGTTAGGEIWQRRTGANARWVRVFSAQGDHGRGYVASLAVLGDFLYAGVSGRVYRTRDGLQWEEIGHLGPYTIEAMAPFGDRLYAGTALPPNAWIYTMSETAPPQGGGDGQ